jgi:hypothetical protein
MFENGVMRSLFVPKREEVIRAGVHNFVVSANIIIVIKLNMIGWA